MLGASEIDDESADRILPAKPIPLQTAVAQRRPEPPLGVCGGSPQVTCILVRHRYGSKPSPGFGLRPQPPSPAVRERGFNVDGSARLADLHLVIVRDMMARRRWV